MFHSELQTVLEVGTIRAPCPTEDSLAAGGTCRDRTFLALFVPDQRLPSLPLLMSSKPSPKKALQLLLLSTNFLTTPTFRNNSTATSTAATKSRISTIVSRFRPALTSKTYWGDLHSSSSCLWVLGAAPVPAPAPSAAELHPAANSNARSPTKPIADHNTIPPFRHQPSCRAVDPAVINRGFIPSPTPALSATLRPFGEAPVRPRDVLVVEGERLLPAPAAQPRRQDGQNHKDHAVQTQGEFGKSSHLPCPSVPPRSLADFRPSLPGSRTTFSPRLLRRCRSSPESSTSSRQDGRSRVATSITGSPS